MLELGRFKLHAVADGTFALDGGAMFGIIPKPLWEKHFPADDKNRIRLALRCLLIEDGARRILVDDGMGDKWSDKQAALYGIERPDGGLDESLARLGFAREAITDVVLTHLHFDHAGGTTRREADGRLALSFPRATYHLQGRNWEWARRPTERDAGSYLAENFAALEASGRLHLVDGETELFPGVRLIPTDGHTTALQLVRVEGGGRTVLYCSDIIPTAAHLRTSWIMGYDLRPLQILEEKKRLLADAVAEGWVLFFEHDPRFAACTVRASGERPGEVVQGDVVAF
jgi:glyoxylase-like metal-dependent hydrolase (beta-lactamase superfamily II)